MDKKERTPHSQRLHVIGARVHNLKNINVSLPRHALCVMTGLSGSGKSSLAFNTIYAEGNRRYLETFSSYARNFMGAMERPDVDKITGLSPVISIEQKTTNRNPRSTVGTTTELYDFLRLLYARTALPYSPATGKQMVSFTEEEILQAIFSEYEGRKVRLYAPIVRDRKGHYRELLTKMVTRGFSYVRVDGKEFELTPGLSLDRYKVHRVEVMIDGLTVVERQRERLQASVRTALKIGEGLLMLIALDTPTKEHYYSRHLMCSDTGMAMPDPAPHTFSFNSPQGSCPHCKGVGEVPKLDLVKIVPDPALSIAAGGLLPIGKEAKKMIFDQLRAITAHYHSLLDTPISELPEGVMADILNGPDYPLRRFNKSTERWESLPNYSGLITYMNDLAERDESAKAKKWVEQFKTYETCPTCGGKRLNANALSFKIGSLDIIEVCEKPLPDFRTWIEQVPDLVPANRRVVATEIAKEIITRTDFLIDVGLHYLTLTRKTSTLSGGESQRIRLATQIGSKLVNVLYILDEPSIGLHQRDNMKLIRSLKHLRDQGNTLIVVEHDKDMMLEADYIVDLGPGAGRKGGKVVYEGSPQQMLTADTLTAQYLRGERTIETPTQRRPGNGHTLQLVGATGNNLKGDTLTLPLGTLTCITGVSGSGKSTLINSTLYPALAHQIHRAETQPLPYKELIGVEHIDKVVCVDQSPIGRLPRSNPATYIEVFTDIRNLFVELPESRMRGYKPGRFSFNVKGGRCEKCQGNGYQRIEMNFLPDVYVPCETCKGMRYNRETLEVRFKGKSIADVLNMTVNMAVEFFEFQPRILSKVKMLQEVGLGYLRLGQPSSTLSGGECQRIKLAAELTKRDTGRTLYFLDEPTTGLHFEDIRLLMGILEKFVERGNTVVIIEHNMDVIKVCDHLVEVGPEGGAGGGRILFSGTPEALVASGIGYTCEYLRRELPTPTQP